MQLSYVPTHDAQHVEERLDRLLVPGCLVDAGLDRGIERLAEDFHRYAAGFPQPLWAPGLAITHEMRALTEALFPYSAVRGVVMHLLRRSCRFPLAVSPCVLDATATWLDLLVRVEPLFPAANPSPLLREAAADPEKRRSFLFSLFLPRHYGGGFDRYPRQYRWISGWLDKNRERLGGRVRVLDAACGSGEGTYGLSELLVLNRYGSASVVHGSTLEPFELFAAAHAYFPHDPGRQTSYRQRVAPLLSAGMPQLEFYLDDLASGKGKGTNNLVLCNGLLGGPMLHGEEELREAIKALAGRLAPGGILLAADRFHEGWKQMVPSETMLAVLKENGLEPLDLPEGVGARRR